MTPCTALLITFHQNSFQNISGAKKIVLSGCITSGDQAVNGVCMYVWVWVSIGCLSIGSSRVRRGQYDVCPVAMIFQVLLGQFYPSDPGSDSSWIISVRLGPVSGELIGSVPLKSAGFIPLAAVLQTDHFIASIFSVICLVII